MTKRETPETASMQAVPMQEHLWLKQMVGDWAYEADATMELGKPPLKFTGTETVRSVGDLWFVAEGRGEMPGGGVGITIMTLGYDPQAKSYVGTWIGSMMTYLWTYRGALDGAGKVLTLDSEGPDMAAPGTMTKFKDVIEFKSSDHRILSSTMLGSDGQWYPVMTVHYRRQPMGGHL